MAVYEPHVTPYRHQSSKFTAQCAMYECPTVMEWNTGICEYSHFQITLEIVIVVTKKSTSILERTRPRSRQFRGPFLFSR